MPKYTFSNREKIMLAVLLVIAVGLLWYRFVFVSVNDQVAQIQSEQQTAEDTITIDQTRLKRKDQIEATLAAYKAQGIEPLKLPEYDNLKNVMAELRTVLGAASSYTLSFDDLYWTDQGLIARGASLSFECASYDEAKALLQNIYSGSYPSMIDSLQLTDDTAKQQSNTSGAGAVKVNAHFVYFETVGENSPTKGLPPKPEEEKKDN